MRIDAYMQVSQIYQANKPKTLQRQERQAVVIP